MSLSVNLPSLTVGVDAYDELGKYTRDFGNKVAIIGGETALKASHERLQSAIDKTTLEVITMLVYGKDATYSNVERLKAIKEVQEADMIFAVGGGRALDTIKVVARDLNKPYFTFPTIASVSAATSAVSVMYHDNHEMSGLEFMNAPTSHCFVDTKVVAEAPSKYLWAGMGDCISKEVESSFSARGQNLSFSNRLGVNMVKGTNEKIMERGREALDATITGVPNDALTDVVLEIIGATALTTVLVDNDLNSNLAHAFYYGYTVLPQAAAHLHGEIVSYGVLVLLTMDEQFEYRDRLKAFMETIDLPTMLADLEVTTEEEVTQILDKAMTMGDLNISPYEITRSMVEQALTDLEGLSQATA